MESIHRQIGHLEARVQNLEKISAEIRDNSDQILKQLQDINASKFHTKGFVAGAAAVFSLCASGATFLYTSIRG